MDSNSYIEKYYSMYSLQDFYGIIYSTYIERLYTIHSETNMTLIHYFPNLHNLWINHKKLWFSGVDFNDLIDIFMDSNLQFVSSIYEKNCVEFDLDLIIQYDQCIRHPCKTLEFTIEKDGKRRIGKYGNKFKLYTSFATQLSFNILHTTKVFENIGDEMKVFVLLCIRHNKSLKMKEFVLKKIYQYMSNSKNQNIWLRFLSATIEDIDIFKKQHHYFGNILFDYSPICLHREQKNEMRKSYYTKYNELLDTRSSTFESHIYTYCMDSSTILNLKTSQGSTNGYDTTLFSTSTLFTYLKQQEYFNELIDILHKEETIGISISGGVDSMVLSFIMRFLCNMTNTEMICIHICYGNRDSQELLYEKYMLQDWCVFLGCKLYIRTIDEIQRKRSSNYRALYEKSTRKIRFSFYEYFKCPIVLGHNRDDCIENVFSNVSKRIHFDNVYGMEFKSIESNIPIIRPFLHIPKNMIYDFASIYYVPYVHDSTPSWSNRGKIRDILIPAIQKVDITILDGLMEYIQTNKKMYKYWELSFEKWVNETCVCSTIFNSQIYSKKIDITIDLFLMNNYQDLQFWVKLWFHLQLDTRPSNKSFSNLKSVVFKYLQTSNETMCRKVYKGDLNKVYCFTIQNDSICLYRK